MHWQFDYTKGAKKQINKLTPQVQERISNELTKVCNLGNPRLRGKCLKGKLSGLWRYKVGDYRVICDIKDSELIVLVIEAGHRREIYKN